jgi:glycosyltransferase involved in cell wall biosynthesis
MASNRPVRVAVLTSVHPPFDTRVFHRQAKSMAAAGFDVLVIAPAAPDHSVDGVRFAGLPSRGGRLARPLRWPVLFARAMRSGADLYHFHDPELLPWGVLLHWLTRKPVIYDSHEYLKEDILGKHWIPSPLRHSVAVASDRIEKWCAHRLSAVIAVTDEMAERFKPFQPRTITVKNLPPVPDLPDPLPARAPVVAYAGLINSERGLDILYETARLVRQRCPEAEFHIVGVVEWDGLPRELAAMSPLQWEAVGVRFLGTIPQPEVAPFLAAASVGWLPRSPHVQNNLLAWPNKLVEYMVVGLPIVASDLPLQARVVREADCGRIVEALSPAAHAAAIWELLEDDALARKLGENGRAVAIERYTWAAEAAKLHSLYTELTAPL